MYVDQSSLYLHVRNHQERLTQAPPTVIARNVLLSASAAWTITPGQTSHYMWVDSVSVIRRKLRRINNLITASCQRLWG